MLKNPFKINSNYCMMLHKKRILSYIIFISLGKTQVLINLAANKQCDGTECPGGCCPGVYGWYCCSDGNYCAVTQADCPQNGAKGFETRTTM